MSVAGVGTDICEIARVQNVLARFGMRFLRRILTPVELRERALWKAPHVARRWALKEAVAKALGTGIGANVGFQDIEITHTPKGAVLCSVKGKAGPIFHVSTSDDGGYVVAFCVMEKA